MQNRNIIFEAYQGALFRKSQLAVKEKKLQAKFKAAIQHVKNICIFGSDNKPDNLWKTHCWSSIVSTRYLKPGKYIKKEAAGSAYRWNFEEDPEESFWVKPLNSLFDPLYDPKFNLTERMTSYLSACLLIVEKRQGNCNELAYLVAKYLWENSEDIHRIEIVGMTTCEHAFVIVNRKGDINNPNSWKNAWIIDAWYDEGIFFKASEFKVKIKEIKNYVKECEDELEGVYSPSSIPFVAEDEILSRRYIQVEIKPQKNLYPRYSAVHKIEDYYTLNNIYEADFSRVAHLANHYNRFKHSLFEISQGKEKNTVNEVKKSYYF